MIASIVIAAIVISIAIQIKEQEDLIWPVPSSDPCFPAAGMPNDGVTRQAALTTGWG